MLQDIYSYSKCCNLLYFFIIFPFLPSLGILAWAHIEMFLEYFTEIFRITETGQF